MRQVVRHTRTLTLAFAVLAVGAGAPALDPLHADTEDEAAGQGEPADGEDRERAAEIAALSERIRAERRELAAALRRRGEVEEELAALRERLAELEADNRRQTARIRALEEGSD